MVNNTPTFREFISESVLIEMPHITLDSGQTVDLELEFHSKMKPDDFIDHIKDWAESKPVTSRNRSAPFKIDPNSVPDFAKAIRSSEWFKMFTKRFYGQEVWVAIDKFLKSKE